MVIAAGAKRRDMLAWQIARGMRDQSLRRFSDLTGEVASAEKMPAAGMTPETMRHNLRIWKYALGQKSAKK